MSKTLKKKLEDRVDYQDEFERLVVEAKSRTLTPTEQRRIDELPSILEGIDSEINSLEANEKLSKRKVGMNNTIEEPGRVFLDKNRTISLVSSKTSLKQGQNEEEKLSLGELIVARMRGPINDIEKAALDTSLDTAGGISTHVSRDFWDKTRAFSTVVKAGASVLDFTDGAHGGVVIPQISGSIQPEWKTENENVTLSDPTLVPRTLEWKTLMAGTKVSNELVQDAGGLLAKMIETDLQKSFASEIDRVALLGSGSGNEPRGVANTSGINVHSMGTNGSALTNFDAMVSAVKLLLDDNIPLEEISGFIMSPREWEALAKLKSATELQQLMIPKQIESIPQYVTQKIVTNQTQGSANNASKIFVGDWSKLVIGVRLSLKIKFHEAPFAQSYSTLITAVTRADIALVHPEAFAVVQGVIPAA